MPLLKVFGRLEFGDWVDDDELDLMINLLRCVNCLRSIFAFSCFHLYSTCVESRGVNANEYWVKFGDGVIVVAQATLRAYDQGNRK